MAYVLCRLEVKFPIPEQSWQTRVGEHILILALHYLMMFGVHAGDKGAVTNKVRDAHRKRSMSLMRNTIYGYL